MNHGASNSLQLLRSSFLTVCCVIACYSIAGLKILIYNASYKHVFYKVNSLPPADMLHLWTPFTHMKGWRIPRSRSSTCTLGCDSLWDCSSITYETSGLMTP